MLNQHTRILDMCRCGSHKVQHSILSKDYLTLYQNFSNFIYIINDISPTAARNLKLLLLFLKVVDRYGQRPSFENRGDGLGPFPVKLLYAYLQSLIISPFCTEIWYLTSLIIPLPGYTISLTSSTKWRNDERLKVQRISVALT